MKEIKMTDIHTKIQAMVDETDVVLFMKGNPVFPQCGFSAKLVNILESFRIKYSDVDVLSDPEIREGIKTFTDWPTIPQLYVKGEFIGGCDIISEMFDEGELEQLFEDKKLI